MKMQADMYDLLKREFLATVDALQATKGPIDYGTRRGMWDVLGTAFQRNPQLCGKLYGAGLDDSHIERALRRITNS